MIADLGCPNSVLGSNDEEKFIKSLSKFQQENLEIVKVDEKVKFGPSKPYSCSHKIRFPMSCGSSVFWGEVSIVNAEIPMLLGNNILKPLKAEILLGNGVLKLNGTALKLTETAGGHYTIKVSDLGKVFRFFVRTRNPGVL